MGKYINIIGQKFNKLTVIERAENDKRGRTRWICKCECGNITTVSRTHLIHNHTKSCGCLQREHKPYTKHNKVHTRLYRIYHKIKERCYNSNNNGYPNYGGRGIKICDDWLNEENGFINFYNWAMSNGYKDNLSIDRIDVNGNYEPSNCRWATMKQQANNKRNNHIITYNGETHNIMEWSEIKNINYSSICYRLKNNQPINEVLSKNNFRYRKNKRVGQYDLNGTLIKTYEKMKDVEYDGFSRSLVCSTCKGNQKTSYGFVWKYLD